MMAKQARLEVTKAIFAGHDLWAPNWGRGAETHGGYLKDIPKPHVRMFPGPRKRIVRVQAVNYYHHWHIRIIEDDNPIWDKSPAYMRPNEPRGWVETWDDEAGKGQSFLNSDHERRDLAQAWIVSILRRHFPPETHEVRDEMNGLKEDYEESDAVKVARMAINRREGD